MNSLHSNLYVTLGKAISKLEDVCSAPVDSNRFVIDASTQRFEFTFELFCKFLKKILVSKGALATYPKDVLRLAFEGDLIDDEAVWLSIIKDRNFTLHIYSQETSDALYYRIKEYAVIFRKSYNSLSKEVTE